MVKSGRLRTPSVLSGTGHHAELPGIAWGAPEFRRLRGQILEIDVWHSEWHNA